MKPEIVHPILIRKAIPIEHQALEDLKIRASLANENDRTALANAVSEIKLPPEKVFSGQVFVADVNSHILGFSIILPITDGTIVLEGLFVEPDFWNRGIGRALVQHASVLSSSLGFDRLHVIGNIHAENFYKLCGFKITEIIKTRFGTGLVMYKDL